MLGKIFRQGGPFSGAEKTDIFEKLVETAVRLFLNGIPHRGHKRVAPDGVRIAEYAPFLRKLPYPYRLEMLCFLQCLRPDSHRVTNKTWVVSQYWIYFCGPHWILYAT